MTDITTLVSTSRLRDFELFTSGIGSIISSYQTTPPAGTLRISTPNTEVKKTDYPELYAKIGGRDGSTSEYFVLPYKAKDGDLEHYLVAKILTSDIVASGNVISKTFQYSDLQNGYFNFNHGIAHTNPIIQVRDEKGGLVLVEETINTVGNSKLKIAGEFRKDWSGYWTALAIG